jgi:two-component system, sensor histidine kinase and response regulator
VKSEPVRVLYMEDDIGLARLLKKKLEREGYSVAIAQDGGEGLSMYAASPYDVVVVDQNMPVHDGLEVIRILDARGPLPPIIMITGAGNEKIAVEALKIGALDYIVKDVEGGYLDLLPPVIDRVIYQHRLAEEKRQADEALRQYAAELKARNEELDAFAHTVAHDLKNPLNNVINSAELLTQDNAGSLDETQQECLRTIVRSALKMDNIIDELLLLAGVRRMEVAIEPLDMAGIVAEARQRLADLIEDTRAEIILPGASDWPVARGYGPWVEEVWVNYLSNALKYGGRPPRIELGADANPSPSVVEGEGGGMMRFWVHDNGQGVTPEDQARLFTPFTRLDQARAKGHGLGLSIVRRIVEKLGGQVGVESNGVPGQGSTFFFTLPGAEHL